MCRLSRAAVGRLWTAFALFSVVIVGLVLRLVNVGTQPFWGDEALSYDISVFSTSLSDLWRYLSSVEVHPPLYYLLLRPWTAWFGHSEAGARSLSVLFGLGVILMSYALARRLFQDRRAGLLAAVVTAVMPFQLQYSQEARPYIIFCFFGVVAAYCLWDYLERQSWSSFWGYVVAVTVGLYLHYSFFLFAAALASWWCFALTVRWRRDGDRLLMAMLAAHAVVFLAYLPWLPSMLSKMTLGKYQIFGDFRSLSSTRPLSLIGGTLDQLVWLTLGETVSPLEAMAVLAFKLTLLAAALAAFAKAACARAFSWGRMVASPWFFLFWLVVVNLALFAVGPQSLPYALVYQRHVIVVSSVLAVALGGMAVELGGKRAAALVALLIATQVTMTARVLANDEVWCGAYSLRAVAQYVNEQASADDFVLIGAAYSRSDFNHYLRPDLSARPIIPINYGGFDLMSERYRLGLIENESQARRMGSDSREAFLAKMEVLLRSRPRRVWTAYLTSQEAGWLDSWMAEHGYRHSFHSLASFFNLDSFTLK